MPTYEYECKKCGKRFERYQPITAKPLKKCPDCGGRVRRIISAGGGIIFKGSGFYETDYKRKGAPSAKSATDVKDSSKEGDSGKKNTENAGKES